MGTEKENGGPAFPGGFKGDDDVVHPTNCGMTLRDYFAAKAMAARLSDHQSVESLVEYAQRTGNHLSKVVADQAYEMANAMLQARKK